WVAVAAADDGGQAAATKDGSVADDAPAETAGDSTATPDAEKPTSTGSDANGPKLFSLREELQQLRADPAPLRSELGTATLDADPAESMLSGRAAQLRTQVTDLFRILTNRSTAIKEPAGSARGSSVTRPASAAAAASSNETTGDRTASAPAEATTAAK